MVRDWDREEKERDRIMRNGDFQLPNRFLVGFTLGGFVMLGVIVFVGWLFNI